MNNKKHTHQIQDDITDEISSFVSLCSWLQMQIRLLKQQKLRNGKIFLFIKILNQNFENFIQQNLQGNIENLKAYIIDNDVMGNCPPPLEKQTSRFEV